MQSSSINASAIDRLARELATKYKKGASIRSLAESTGRSYGFIHKTLLEYGVALRGKDRRRPLSPTLRLAASEDSSSSEAVSSNVDAIVYLPEGGMDEGIRVAEAVRKVLIELGFDQVDAYKPVISSFWQKFKGKASDPQVRAALEDRMVKLERAAEVHLLALPESQANSQNAQGIAAVIESIKNERAAVIQIGSLLLVKIPGEDERGVLVCKTLTPRQLRHLELNPELLQCPAEVIAKLSNIVSVDDSVDTISRQDTPAIGQ